MVKFSNMLKKSRIHGMNRTSSYYRIKSKRSKWYKVRRKRIYYKARSNNKRISPLSHITNRYVRLRGLARIALFNRLWWKSIYPGVNVTKVIFDRHSNLRDSTRINGESLLWKIESRLDVVLWRSGIVATIPIAKQLVRSGKVELFNNNKWEVVKRSDKIIDTSIVLKLINWDTLRTIALNKWQSKVYKHKVPPFRLTDYTNGMIAIVHKPKDGEVRVPSYLPIRLASLMKRA